MSEPSLGARLAAARHAGELSARALDQLVGLSGGYTSRIENDARVGVGATNLSEYARVLGVSIDWLVDGKGKMPGAVTIRRAVQKARDEKGAA